VERLGSIVLIDTGAVYGGYLSAYCPETDAVVQVQGAATDTSFPRPADLNRRLSVLAGEVGPC
jgi:serine/threonine protein phosphatase 1